MGVTGDTIPEVGTHWDPALEGSEIRESRERLRQGPVGCAHCTEVWRAPAACQAPF